jgi:hypothetical protein
VFEKFEEGDNIDRIVVVEVLPCGEIVAVDGAGNIV